MAWAWIGVGAVAGFGNGALDGFAEGEIGKADRNRRLGSGFGLSHGVLCSCDGLTAQGEQHQSGRAQRDFAIWEIGRNNERNAGALIGRRTVRGLYGFGAAC
jgi:hypothetical protein